MKTSKIIFAMFIGLGLRASAQTLANYQSTVMGQGPISYFTLDNGNLGNAVVANPATQNNIGTGGTAAGWTGGFGFDVFNDPASAVFFTSQFDGLELTTGGVISGGGAATTNSTAQGSISFLFKTLDSTNNTGRRYLFSAGGGINSTNSDGSTNFNNNAFEAFFESTNVANGSPNALKLRFGNSTTTILPVTNIAPDAWYYLGVTYTESGVVSNKATWYLGRVGHALTSGVTTNDPLDVAGDGFNFWIGNYTNDNAALRNPGSGMVDEFASWNRQLSPAEIQAQFATLPSFMPASRGAYQGVVTGQAPAYYFKLDGSYVDAVSGTLTLGTNSTGNSFGSDWFEDSAGACIFTLGADGLTNGNLLAAGGTVSGGPGTGKGTVSCLFRSLSTTNFSGQKFICSAGGGTAVSNAFGVFFENLTSGSNPGSLKVRVGSATTTILQASNVVTAAWYYFAMTYDETATTNQTTWWLGQPGGTLRSGVVSGAAGGLAGQGNVFVIGNNTNFSASLRNTSAPGEIDEFAIWHRPLSATEVTNQFNALIASTPSGPPPLLSIVLTGGNTVVSWPSNTDTSYVLQSTTNLLSTWSAAGSPTVVGTNFVVTNAVTPGATFYRLQK